MSTDTEADKIVAELMALAERFAYHSALIDETHIETRDALEQAIRRAVDCGEPVAKIKPSQKSMRELLSEVALGDSQPVAQEHVAEVGAVWTLVWAGKEPLASILRRHPEVRIGSKLYASPQRAEPASVQALLSLLRRIEPHIDAIVCYASTMGEHEPNRIAHDLRAVLAAHPSTDQNHSG